MAPPKTEKPPAGKIEVLGELPPGESLIDAIAAVWSFENGQPIIITSDQIDPTDQKLKTAKTITAKPGTKSIL